MSKQNKKPTSRKVPEDGIRVRFDPIDRKHIEEEAAHHGGTQRYIKDLVKRDRFMKQEKKR